MRSQFHSDIIAHKTLSWLIALVKLSPVDCNNLKLWRKEFKVAQRLFPGFWLVILRLLLLKNRNHFPSEDTKILL